MIYCRLKQVDFDGTLYYSELVVLASAGKQQMTLKAWPDPVLNKLTTQIKHRYFGVTVNMRDITRLTYYSESLSPHNIMRLESETWPALVYLLRCQSPQNTIRKNIIKH